MSNENPTEVIQDEAVTTQGEEGNSTSEQSAAVLPDIRYDRVFYQPPTKITKTQIPINILVVPSKDSMAAVIQNAKAEGSSSINGYNWALTINQAAEESTATNFGEKQLNAEGAVVRQKIQADNGKTISTKVVGMGDVGSDGKLSGNAAKHRIRTLISAGSTRRYPLLASGFWITLESPDDLALLNLDDAIADEKADIAAQTAGLALGLSQVLVIKHLMELIKQNVFSVNIDDANFDVANLMRYIKITDLLGLIQFVASLIYPNGYAFQIPCTAGDGCVNVDEAAINLNDFIAHLWSKMTPEQCNYMADHTVKRSLKNIADYQEKYINKTNVKLAEVEDVSINLRVPSIADYINAGEVHLAEIRRVIDETIGQDGPYARKERTIRNIWALTSAREFTHCVESVVTPPRTLSSGEESDNESIEDTVTLTDVLDILSTRPDITNAFIVDCKEFLESATYTFVSMPIHKCTSCGRPQAAGVQDDPLRPSALVPYDPVAGFFILKDRRLQRGMRSSTND